MMKSKILLVVSYIAVGLFLLSGCMKNEETEGTQKIREAYAAKIAAQTLKLQADAEYVRAEAAHQLALADLQKSLADINRAAAASTELQTEITKGSKDAVVEKAKQEAIQAATAAMLQAEQAAAKLVEAKKATADAVLRALLFEDEWKSKAFDDFSRQLYKTGGYYDQKKVALENLHKKQVELLEATAANVDEAQVLLESREAEAKANLDYAMDLLATYKDLLNKTIQDATAAKDDIKNQATQARSKANADEVAYKKLQHEKEAAEIKMNEYYTEKGDDPYYIFGAGYETGVYNKPTYIVSDPIINVDEATWTVKESFDLEGGLEETVKFLEARIKYLTDAENTGTATDPKLENGYGDKTKPGNEIEIDDDGNKGYLVSKKWLKALYDKNEKDIALLQSQSNSIDLPLLNAAEKSFDEGFASLKAAETAYAKYFTDNATKNISTVNETVYNSTALKNFLTGATDYTTADTTTIKSILADYLYHRLLFDGYGGYLGNRGDGEHGPGAVQVKGAGATGKWTDCSTLADFQAYFNRQDLRLSGLVVGKEANLRGLIDMAFGSVYGSNIGVATVQDCSDFKVLSSIVGRHTFAKISNNSIFSAGTTTFGNAINLYLSNNANNTDAYKKSVLGNFASLVYKVLGGREIQSLSHVNDFVTIGNPKEQDWSLPAFAGDVKIRNYFGAYTASLIYGFISAEETYKQNTDALDQKKEDNKAVAALQKVCDDAIKDFEAELVTYKADLAAVQAKIDAQQLVIDAAQKAVNDAKLVYNISLKKYNDLNTIATLLSSDHPDSDIDLITEHLEKINDSIEKEIVGGDGKKIVTGFLVDWTKALQALQSLGDKRTALLDEINAEIARYDIELARIVDLIESIELKMDKLYE